MKMLKQQGPDPYPDKLTIEDMVRSRERTRNTLADEGTHGRRRR